jgi:hypothetical protein
MANKTQATRPARLQDSYLTVSQVRRARNARVFAGFRGDRKPISRLLEIDAPMAMFQISKLPVQFHFAYSKWPAAIRPAE